MTAPLDPTDRAAMIELARTPFRENDYLTIQAIMEYTDPHCHNWGLTPEQIDDALYEDALDIYRTIVPEGFMVVRKEEHP